MTFSECAIIPRIATQWSANPEKGEQEIVVHWKYNEPIVLKKTSTSQRKVRMCVRLELVNRIIEFFNKINFTATIVCHKQYRLKSVFSLWIQTSVCFTPQQQVYCFNCEYICWIDKISNKNSSATHKVNIARTHSKYNENNNDACRIGWQRAVRFNKFV